MAARAGSGGSAPVYLTDTLTRSAEGLIANLRAADAVAQRQARRAVTRHAEAVVRLTKQYCPVDTRWMLEHATYRLSPSGLVSQQGWWAEDFTPYGLPFYPPYVEFGTSRTIAQPSLYPATMVLQPAFVTAMGDVLRASVRRMGGR